MDQSAGVEQTRQTNPYRNRLTVMSLVLNALFFYFCWVFLTKLFRYDAGTVEYLRPTDVTAWVLLPIFAVSALLLGSNAAYQLLSRKTGEVYFAPVFLLNVIQFLTSIAIVLFILNALTCVVPRLFGLTIC